MLSTDRTILTPGSGASERMRAYGTLVDTLYILLAGTGPESHTQLGPNVTVVYPGGSSKAVNFFRLLYTARAHSADLISAQDPVWTGLIAIFSRTRAVQIQVHTDTWGTVGSWIAAYVLRRATCVRVVSERVRKKVSTITTAPIHMLPIFVDATRFTHTSAEPVEYGHGPRLLMVARLAPEKRVDRTLHALTEVPDAHLYIVGEGPLKDSLQRTADSLQLTDRVHFLGWKADVVPYYQHADCFVSTSAFEGYGMALLEAALAGCPIVSTNVGIASELPRESVTVVSGDQYELAKAMQASLTPERKASARAAADTLRATQGDFAHYLAEYQKLLLTCGT